MIKLYQFPISKKARVLNFSPFCIKVEIFLRLNKIKHQIIPFNGNPSSAPQGKLPYIDYNGKKIADSSVIIKLLSEDMKIDMDSHLNDQERAISFSVRKMMEEHLYWILIYSRWVDEDNWKTSKSVLFGFLPPILGTIIPALARKTTVKSCFAQGTARHPKDTVYVMGEECIDELSILLDKKDFFFGDKVGLLDITAHAFLSNILFDYNPTSRLKNYIVEKRNLVEFVKRLENKCSID